MCNLLFHNGTFLNNSFIHFILGGKPSLKSLKTNFFLFLLREFHSFFLQVGDIGILYIKYLNIFVQFFVYLLWKIILKSKFVKNNLVL